MHEKRIARAYHLELGAALLVYVALLFASIRYGRPMAEGALRTVALGSPMIGFGLMIWAVARRLRRSDEYQRQFALEAVAIAAAVTAGLSFTYGFLETAGYPRLSMFIVWPVMAAVWGVTTMVRGWLLR